MRQGYQNEAGEILFGNIREFLSQYYGEEDLQKTVDPCVGIRGGIPADNAFKALMCILRNLKSLEQNENEI